MNGVEADGRRASGIQVSAGQANYILAMVTFAYAMSYVDRQLLNLLVEPIKQSLVISDTEFSFIQGTAFVASYMAAAPVFGRLVDVVSRRNILAIGVFSWCFFTVISGFCTNYNQLFLARMGVGVTEACVFPAAWSMIGDSFPAKRLPRAMAIFLLGPMLGGGFSLIAGGLLITFAATLAVGWPMLEGLEPWQVAFVVTGVPGMLFAFWLLTVREPPRQTINSSDMQEDRPSLAVVGAYLRRNKRFYGLIYLSNGLLALVQLAVPGWFPAFMMRVHAMSPLQTGLTLGIISAVCALTGSLTGAATSEWLTRKGYADAPLRAAAMAILPAILSAFLVPLVPTSSMAFATAGGVVFFTAFAAGLLSAATQMGTPPQMRGVVASLYTFAAQVVGYMMGPTLVALLTDRYFRDPTMVGHSLQIVMTAGSAILALCLFALLKTFRQRVAELGVVQ